jgi:SAM-dependent methyltransferase
MEALHRDSAALLRARLGSEAVAPATFRASLADVPVQDRDTWLDLVFEIDGIPDDEPELPRGCVPYLPCSVATLLDMIEFADVQPHDVFVDVGCGLGRATALTRLSTGASCIGIEIQPGLVRAARALAQRSGLSRTSFVQGDAAELVAAIAIGTVFFLYCPFSGDRLRRVLADLESIAQTREIRVCCVDVPLPACGWLAPVSCTSPDLAIYRSVRPMAGRVARGC